MTAMANTGRSTAFDLSNQVVVISGGAGLLGQTFARAVAQQGGRPVIADVRVDAAETVARQINADLGTDSVSAIEIDITSKSSVQQSILILNSRFGKIDALVNSAYPRNNNYGRKFEEVEYSDFCENINLHLGGYFLTSQQFASTFKRQGHGNIITIASIYGVIAPRFDIYSGTLMTMPVEYAAIKAALIHLNAYMLKYFQGSGVRFNCISPGGIFDSQPESFVQRYATHSQSKRMLDPTDISGTLLFLLSDHSRHLNGQNIVVDDGWSK
jgi:NAD(P)-dependent dehydrogenase (short-subunit alcohol dehydrogenase family)